jgi:hypothetical protein
VLPICVSDGAPRNFDHGIRVFLHADARLAIGRRLIDLGNYEADEVHFPILYVPKASPKDIIQMDGKGILDYRSKTGRRVDYVLVWDMLKDPSTVPIAPAREELENRYTPIYVSPRGYLKLYQCNEMH